MGFYMAFSDLHIAVQAAIKSSAREHHTAHELKKRLVEMGVKDLDTFKLIDRAYRDAEVSFDESSDEDHEAGSIDIIICPAHWCIDDAVKIGCGEHAIGMTIPRQGSPVRAIYTSR